MTKESLQSLSPIEQLKLLRRQLDAAVELVESGGMVQGDQSELFSQTDSPLFVLGDFAIYARWRWFAPSAAAPPSFPAGHPPSP